MRIKIGNLLNNNLIKLVAEQDDVMVYKINNLLPRNEYLINNKYYILNNKNNDDFHLVINILNDKIKIIIRKMNNNEGWLNDLIIKIYDINENKYELISIGSCDKNCKIINYKISNIKIVIKEPINQKITKTKNMTINHFTRLQN